MQLEVGKTYLSRNGVKVTITGRTDYEDFSFMGMEDSSQTSQTYGDDGRWSYAGGSNYDLIKEANPKLQLRVGATYISGEGKERAISHIDESKGEYKYCSCATFPYSEDGRAYAGETYNLIREKVSIKLGKTYMRNDGEIVTCTVYDPHPVSRFVAKIGGVWYTVDGRYSSFRWDDKERGKYHILQEVVTESEQQTKEYNMSNLYEKLQATWVKKTGLKVGDTVRVTPKPTAMLGWNNSVTAAMEHAEGKSIGVRCIYPDGIELHDRWIYPFYCLEKVSSVKEMTVKDIEAALGYAVKIVK